MTVHRTHVARNPHGTRFWWVCDCGSKGEKKHYFAYAELAGNHHVRDKGRQ